MKKYIPVVFWVLLICVWFGATYTKHFMRLIIPTPIEFIGAIPNIWTSWGWGQDPIILYVGTTVWKFLIAALIATAIGVPIGVLKVHEQTFNNTVGPIIGFFRAIPAVNLFSLFYLAFGYGPQTHIAMSVFRGVLDSSTGSEDSIRRCETDVIEAAQLDGAGTWEIVRYITFPLAIPGIITNLRTTWSVIFVLIQMGESLMGSSGLGGMIRDAHMTYRIPEMWIGIILSGFCGIGIDKFLCYLKKTLVTWE